MKTLKTNMQSNVQKHGRDYLRPDYTNRYDCTAMNCKTDPCSFALGLTGKLVVARTLAQSPFPAAGVLVSGSKNTPLVLLCYLSLALAPQYASVRSDIPPAPR